MCIGSNSVNQAQDLMFVTKFEDFPNSLLPNIYTMLPLIGGIGPWVSYYVPFCYVLCRFLVQLL